MTEEELRVAVERGLIGPVEKSAIRQAEMAKLLQTHPGAANKRMDVGSQIGRAGTGIAGALSMYRSGVAEQAGLSERQATQMKLANLARTLEFAKTAKAAQAQAAASGVSGAITPGIGTDDDENYWGASY